MKRDHAEQALDDFDESSASAYRREDETGAGYASRTHYCKILRNLCAGFDRRINVLDVGCGTGRYFHCLRGVARLVGIDISAHMLELARDPVRSAELDIGRVELLCGEIHSLPLPERSFDLICSIGVIGEYLPVNAALLGRCHALLARGGTLFFTAVDTYSRLGLTDRDGRLAMRALRRLFLYLPPRARRLLNKSVSSCYVAERDLSALLQTSPFARFEITRYEHVSGWLGTHFDCLAQTTAGGMPPA
jgi:SAM-dependent methyltransferase